MARIIKAPIRAISKAVDLYAKGVTNFSIAYNRPIGNMAEIAHSSQLPSKSFIPSRLPGNDQSPEGALFRSVTADAMGNKASYTKLTNFEMYIIRHHCYQLQSGAFKKGVLRNCNVGMEKIDEDKISTFKDDNIVFKSRLCVNDGDLVFLKSHSNDMSNKRSQLT